MKPTEETYDELQLVFDTFNRRLFGNQLPECLIALQREQRTYGYFSADRFVHRDGKRVDEIAINPAYFAVVPLVEIFQTMAHEQTHLWQKHFGHPGRGRYHNGEWADKMESIGLMPSSTGQPGGKRTGDRVSDYPIPGGLFLSVCEELLTADFRISWYDRFAATDINKDQRDKNAFLLSLDLPAGAGVIAEGVGVNLSTGAAGVEVLNEKKSNRSKYLCGCGISVWGKPSLNILCGECGQRFDEWH